MQGIQPLHLLVEELFFSFLDLFGGQRLLNFVLNLYQIYLGFGGLHCYRFRWLFWSLRGFLRWLHSGIDLYRLILFTSMGHWVHSLDLHEPLVVRVNLNAWIDEGPSKCF